MNFEQQINVFYGSNGSGKTSVLESLHYLSTGKSFRKSNFKNLINSESEDLTVFIADNLNQNFSVYRNIKGDWKAKINNKNIRKHSDITSFLKVISIDPEVYRLIDSGPMSRRSFLDWYVFHVKHNYLSLWKNTHRTLKHINTLLKQKAQKQELIPWENRFIDFAHELNLMRCEYFDTLVPYVRNFINLIQPELNDIELSFKQGWSEKLELKDQLIADREKNHQYGTLQNGPHKMDIRIKFHNQAASQTLSRGQKKILSIIFYLATFEVLKNSSDTQPILCLDDLDAELDDEKIQFLADYIQSQNSQVFLTSVFKDRIKNVIPDAQMFHVKHGQILRS